MRRRVLLYLTLIGVSACNGDRIVRPTDASTSPTNDISDATHSAADMTSNPDFFFLPPMVANPSASPAWDVGAFNPDLTPSVNICAYTANVGDDLSKAPCTPLAALPAVVDPIAEQYKVNWTVPNSSTVFYRLDVVVGTRRLGYADVQTAANASQLKNVATDEFIPLVDGRTLPIKLRIERYALCEIPGKGPCATKAVDVDGTGGTVALPLVDNSTAQNGAFFAPSGTVGTRKPTITVERCAGFRERGLTDLPAFGPCVRVRIEPALSAPLARKALVFSCDVTAASVVTDGGVVSRAQAERITMHRLAGTQLEALPHEHPSCGISPTAQSLSTANVRRMFAQLARGNVRSVAKQVIAMLAPKPLYAARFIDLGGGGLTAFGDGLGASVSPTNGPRLSVGTTGGSSVHEFQFLLPAKFDYISTPTDQPAFPADQLPVNIRVTDLGNEPVMNARVHLSADNDGTVTPLTLVTGSDAASRGIATVSWTVSAKSPNTLTATGLGIAGQYSHGPRDPHRTPDQIDPFQPCDAEWEVVKNPYSCVIDGKATVVGTGSMQVTAITVGNIDGQVIDAQTGDAIDVTVTWSPFGPAAPTSATGGAFRIENLTPGPRSARQQYSVSFTSSKHQNRARAGVDILPKQTTHLGDVCLAPSNGSISGTVVSTLDGKPIDPDALTVTATQTTVPFSDKCVAAGDAAPAPAVVTASGSHGAFAIAGLPPGNYTLSVHSDDYDDATVADVVVKAAEETAKPAIPLKWKFGNITGSVVKSSDASPLSGVTVSDGTNTATSAADGSFLLRRLVPGAHTVTYSAVGYVRASRDATVTASQSTALPAVQLDPAPASALATVSPESFTGACPKQFVFTATISAAPGTAISYVWDRSDGATMTPLTVVTNAAGSATVQATWDLSPASFSGWEQLRMTLPDGTVVTSNQANFTLTCTAS